MAAVDVLQPAAPTAPPVARERRRTDTPRASRARGTLGQAGGMALLLAMTVRAALRRPIQWKGAVVDESLTLVRRCTLPLGLSVFAFGFGTIGVQAGLVFNALGAIDRTGGIYVTGSVRELAGWATAMVVAGVGGTAICADLGARKIREELDALSVLGVDPMRALVVPRVLALALMTPLLNMVGVLFCTLSGVLATMVLYDVAVASFFATFAANFTVAELLGAVLKTFFFGLIIGVVCCYKGLNTKGGPEGVGRAVNEAVVLAFAALWIFNYAFTSVLLASYPALQGLR